jgi:uncharacterized membrane protein YhaH (DUF805 family)
MATDAATLGWLFFSFRGRIARQSFLLGAGFLLLPQVLFLWQLVKAEEAGSDGALAFWFLFLCASVLVSLWSLIALFVKRLHDLDLPSALCVLAVISGINFFFFLFLAAMPSKQITTRHGPPPFPR